MNKNISSFLNSTRRLNALGVFVEVSDIEKVFVLKYINIVYLESQEFKTRVLQIE